MFNSYRYSKVHTLCYTEHVKSQTGIHVEPTSYSFVLLISLREQFGVGSLFLLVVVVLCLFNCGNLSQYT